VFYSLSVSSQESSMWMHKGDVLWEERGEVRKKFKVETVFIDIPTGL